jgi:ABC-type uncharacterized transport system permease subunit
MVFAVDLTFYAALMLYVAAAVAMGLYLRRGDVLLTGFASRFVLAGGLLLSVTFALRWVMWGRLPLTTMADGLNLFIIMATAIVLYMSNRHQGVDRALLCFYTPPLVLLYAVNAVLAFGDLHREPKALNGAFLAVHVGLAVLAYALFFVASVTSIAYVFQARSLKRLHTVGLFQKLPSLEQLDRTLYHLIAFGYVFFAITLVLGLIWAYIAADELSARWWLSAKIVRAFFMVALYSTAFHGRRMGRLRGQKLAYLVFVGFAVMLGGYLALGLLNLQDYNFWSAHR